MADLLEDLGNVGIAGAGNMKKVGRVGGKALIYFEVVSTFALIIGLLVVNIVKPGAGFNVDPRTLDANAVADYAKRAASQTTADFILHVIPATFLDAFTGSGDLLQVLFVAILFGYAMTRMGPAAHAVREFIETCSHIFFAMMNTLMKLAPLGAGGAMAFTIGRYGIAALRPLAMVMGSPMIASLSLPLVSISLKGGNERGESGQHLFAFLAQPDIPTCMKPRNLRLFL